MEKLKAFENGSDVNTDPEAKLKRKIKKAKPHSDSDYMYSPLPRKKVDKNTSSTLKRSNKN